LDDTTFVISVAPADGVTLLEAETMMDDVIADFLAADIPAERMDSIRTQLRASEIYAKDNIQGLARRYGSALTQGLSVQDVQDWPNVLQSVTAKDVKAVAAKVLQRNQAVTGWVVSTQEEAQ
jgi:zinc protease